MEISSLIDGAGAESNAFTGKEYTGYYIKSAASRVELSLDILSDMLANLLLDSKEIEKEKGVIIEEINLYEDNPPRKIGDVFENLLYGDTPMGWDIAGNKDVIRGADRDIFVNYMKSLYSASNMVVIVAGKVDVDETQEMVKKFFSGHPTFTTEGYKSVIEGQKDPAVLIQHKKTDQAHFGIGVRTVGVSDEKDKYPLSVLAAILGGGMSSRLFHEVREARGLAYYVRTISENYMDCGYLTTFVGADPARIDEAIRVVADEYKKVKKDGEITEEELTKAKEYLKGHFVLELEDTRSVAVYYGSDFLLEKKLENPEEIIKRIEKVKLADVMRVAKEYLSRPLNLAIIGNFEDKARFEKLLA
jgi:predicted Zn-dependent peptidase